MVSMFFDLIPDDVPEDCTTNGTQESMVLLVTQVVARCATDQGTAQATLAVGGVGICAGSTFAVLSVRVAGVIWWLLLLLLRVRRG